VRPGHRHLDGPAQRVLPLDLGEIAAGIVPGRGHGARRGHAARQRRQRHLAREKTIRLVERAHGIHGDAFHQRRLLRGAGRKEQAALAEVFRQQGGGEGATHGTGGAGEAELAGDQVSGQMVGGELAGGAQNAEGDGQIVEGTLLADVARREIDGRARARHVKAAVAERGTDAVLGFLHRGIGQADEDEIGRASLARVDLDEDDFGFDALQRGGVNGRQHVPDKFPESGKRQLRRQASSVIASFGPGGAGGTDRGKPPARRRG
jgi:hypothetical protein